MRMLLYDSMKERDFTESLKYGKVCPTLQGILRHALQQRVWL